MKISSGIRIKNHAVNMMKFYAFFRNQVENEGSFKFVIERQCYRDALESMKNAGLIEDYDLSNFTIKMDDGCDYGLTDGKLLFNKD